MGELDSEMPSSTKSSLDSGFDIGFLSDSSTSSSKSDCCPMAYPSKCVFSSNTKTKQSNHHCALNMYRISGVYIKTLSPRTFLYLGDCVRELDLSKNNIKILPETLSELKNLQKLNLSYNELQSVPDSCKSLQQLQVLNLSWNKLIVPPLCLELGMERLTLLDLSGNTISNFPNAPKCSQSLQVLNLSHNCLHLVPLWLLSHQCQRIKELDISFNYCFDDPTLKSQLPLLKHHRTSALKTLKKLKLNNTGNNSGLISPLSSFESVQSLHLGNLPGLESTFNHFSEFKLHFLYNPGNIVELHLPKIGLAGLPEDISRFQNLEFLDASHNSLDWLPESFGLLKSLKELIISNCNLSYLPDNFGLLKSLKKLHVDHNKLTDIKNSLNGLSSLEWLDTYDNALEELPFSPEHLQNLDVVDLAYNYIDLEVALDVESNGEKLFDVYCCQQARLREETRTQTRNTSVKVSSHIPSWESLESLHRSRLSDSYSDLSQQGDSTQFQYFDNQVEEVEENWDEDSASEVDPFEPDLVHRYRLPLGQYQFGWTPPIKRKECQIPFNQQVSGFVYIPGQLHQKTTIRKRRKRVKDLPVVEGQFDNADVDHFADLQKAESLGVLLRKMYMFIRNPAGLRSKRRCKFHSIYEDCLHHGLWYRLSPPITFEIPEDMYEEDEDI